MQQINQIADHLYLIQQGNNSYIHRRVGSSDTVVIKSVFHGQLFIEDDNNCNTLHQRECQDLQNEWKILSQLNHPNIIKPKQFIPHHQLDPAGGNLQCCIVLIKNIVRSEYNCHHIYYFNYSNNNKLIKKYNVMAQSQSGFLKSSEGQKQQHKFLIISIKIIHFIYSNLENLLYKNHSLYLENATCDLYTLCKTNETSLKIIIKYFSQISIALQYLHSQYIAHNDIKLENMLVSNRNCVKLADFGFSYKPSFEDLLTKWLPRTLTPYSCPEIVNFRLNLEEGEFQEFCLFSADVYALTTALFLAIYKRPPILGQFPTKDDQYYQLLINQPDLFWQLDFIQNVDEQLIRENTPKQLQMIRVNFYQFFNILINLIIINQKLLFKQKDYLYIQNIIYSVLENLKDLIEGGLAEEYNRITATEFVNHEFFKYVQQIQGNQF